MAKDFQVGKSALIVYLHGEIDQYAAAELKERIDIEIEHSPKKNLIIDLTHVELMDSSGIGLIVGRYKVITAIGGKIALCSASKSVQKMLGLSGIGKIVNYYETAAEAEKALTT